MISNKANITGYIVLFIFIVGGGVISMKYFNYCNQEEDIYFIYRDSKKIAEGYNPYSAIKSGDMRNNQKYATYFPLFYYQSALFYKLGFKDFSVWLKAWRILYLLITTSLCLFIYNELSKKINVWIGLFSVAIWQFHAYTFYVLRVSQFDFLPILFMLLSLTMIEKNFKRSLLLFGISLSFKQIGIFLVPIYILFAYKQLNDWRKALKVSFLYGGIIPFVASLPFLIWDTNGYLKSILFSATRYGVSHFGGFRSLDNLMDFHGIISVLPMMLMMSVIFYSYYKNITSKYLSCFLIFAIFNGFNSVLFKQYLIWQLLFIPFLILEFYQMSQSRTIEGTNAIIDKIE